MEYKIKENSIITYINSNYDKDGMTGLLIETSNGPIKILIDDYQNCCENYGPCS